MNSKINLATATLLGTTAMAFALSARAQTVAANSSTAGASEVVVTAQKRASTVQNTAASIVAVTGGDLQARGITSVADLAMATPGVSLKSEGPSQTEIEMRGMTSSGGNTATVGFYLDDVPLTGPAGAQNGHVIIDPALYDLNRVEVLRGPQGTLYGASSMGGTVKLVANLPDLSEYHGSFQSTLSGTDGGGFNHSDNGMINIPLVRDQLALRIVGTEGYTSGWIDRVVANPFPTVNYNPNTGVATRGNVQQAPVQAQYPNSNADQIYSTRVSLLWKPTSSLTITPSFFYQTDRQNGASAYDSAPGLTNKHYQVFDIAEPLTDKIMVFGLNADWSFDNFDITSSTGQWWRRSTQVQDASEEFNNPNSGATVAAETNLFGPQPGYYGPAGTGPEYGVENDPSKQLSEELRITSKGSGPFTWVGGVYYSDFQSTWTFSGTTPNASTYLDLGSLAPATTPNWFDANEPTRMKQYAVFGDATYALTSRLKADVGVRVNDYDYRFSACITGWGSGLGAAAPSCTGLVKLNQVSANPKFNLTYTFDPDLMAYATVSNGSRPGGGDALYPTTGAIWGPAFAAYHFSGTSWPRTFKPDYVWSYELGEKARFFHRRLTVDASVYYEDWNNIQLEAYPNVWALNINGKSATIAGADIDAIGILGAGFKIEASAGYLHENLDPGPHWQITPNVLPEVTPVNVDIILSYKRPITEKYTFLAQIESNYTGAHYSLEFPNFYEINGKYLQLPGYDLTNLRAGIQSNDGWEIALFGKNIGNTHAQLESLFALNEASSAFNRIVTNQPLTAGVDLSFHY